MERRFSKKRLLKLLDRPGVRTLLAVLTSRIASREAQRAVTVFFKKGIWGHAIDGEFYADSLNFDYDRNIFRHWRNQSEYLRQEAQNGWFSAYNPRPGDVIIDIGAGRGEHLMAMCAAVGPTGKVIAVEADPESFRCLTQTCIWNGLYQVRLVHCAVIDQFRLVKMKAAKTWQENSVEPVLGSEEGTLVQGITLDHLIESQGIEQVDLLKMNIEGGEAIALVGLSRNAHRIQNLCISCHDFRAKRGDGDEYHTAAAVLQSLREKGFDAKQRDDDDRPHIHDQVLGRMRE